MSSSSFRPPSHLHRVNLHSHGKRPFEECGGYDSDPDSSMPIHSTTSGTSSSSTNNLRFPPTTSTTSQEARNKRARSTSSTSTDPDSSPSSSSSGYNTAQSSSRSDISYDAPSLLPVNPVDCPIRPLPSSSPFVATQDVHMSDLHLPILSTQPQRTHVPSSLTPEDTLRTSLQRFAEFDRQIAALRTSLAGTRSPSLPPLGPSVDGDPSPLDGHWHPNPSNFLSNDTSAISPPSSTSSTAAIAPSETFNSLSTIASSNDSTNVPVTASIASSGVPSASFLATFSNVPRYPPCPSYRSSATGSSSHTLHDHVEDPPSSNSTLPFVRPSSNESSARMDSRSSVSVESSGSGSNFYVRRTRRSLSPLVFSPDTSSSSSPPSADPGGVLSRYRTLYNESDHDYGRSRRRGVDSPVRILDPESPSSRSGEQPRLSSQTRPGSHARVIREHSIEREPLPSVFDVFNIGESDQDRIRPPSVRERAASRYLSIPEPVPPRVVGSHNEGSRGPAPTTTSVNANSVPPQEIHSRAHSSWTSIPSSNTLMSESASERRHALALERFRARLRRSSFDADDESDSRWSGSSRSERESGLGVVSPVPPSPSVESVPGTTTNSHFPPLGTAHVPLSTTNRIESAATSTPLQRSLSELLAESEEIGREEGADDWLFDWDASRVAERARQRARERQREREWEWERGRERQRERPSQDVQGRSFPSGLSLASTSSAREDLMHPPAPASSGLPQSSLDQLDIGITTTIPNVSTTTTTTNNSQQYSYSNLNLASFQSGLFRDSLRRNAEVDQTSFSSSGLVIHPVTSGESRVASRLAFEDSGSDMDLDDFAEQRLRYAGHTPPPDYTPAPRSLSPPLPGFSVLRRGSHDSQGRPQHLNRNSMIFTRPVQQVPSGPVRPTLYENNTRPAPTERTDRDRFLPTRILESFYRSQEDGRRNVSGGTRQPYHSQRLAHQNHSLPSSSIATSRNDATSGPQNANGNGNINRPPTELVGENRRSPLGLGGSIRSRFARFANPQSSSNSADASSSRQRSPHPIGARPQTVESHRRGSSVFGNVNLLGQESRPDARSVSGPPPHWNLNPGVAEPSGPMIRDVPWRASSGPRSAFAPPLPASGSARAEISDGTSRADEQRSRFRTLRQRLQLDRNNESARVFRPGILRAAMGRRGNLGDYVPDELFDDSYEALLSLSSMLGEVRSRATPEDVITSLPTGTFKEWKKEDSETRCPICLDDYEPSDIVMKLIECTHWLHKNCLEQWLRTANTCPVCREKVKTSPKPAPARRRPTRDYSGSSETNHGGSGSTSGNGLSGRPPHTQPQLNNGRPVSFAAMVFDRLMNDGRDGIAEPWSSSPPSQVPAPAPTRDTRNVLFERLRAVQQPQQQHHREPSQPVHAHDHHDVYIPFPPPHDLAYHHRVPPTSQPGPSIPHPTAGSGSSGSDGSGMRPLRLVSQLRGQGSGASMGTNSSTNMAEEVGTRPEASGRRSMMVGTNGGPGSESGSLFLDTTMQRREPAYPFVPPTSSGFTGLGGSPPPPPQTHSHFDAPMTIPNQTEPSREWRSTRMYDALFNVDASRSSSSSSSSSLASTSQSRPMGMANRIMVEEENPFEEYVFGWSLRRGPLGHPYPFEDPARRGSREGTSSGS